MNVTGAFALILGALFSAYVFMPKRRVLDYSLDPGQPGDQFLFHLLIAPIAITRQLRRVAAGALVALARGDINSRVPATLLIALGAFIPALTDSLNRFGSTDYYQLGKLLGACSCWPASSSRPRRSCEVRVPFTSIVLRGSRPEAPEATKN